MGQQVAKTTTISTDLDLSHWNGLWCTHTDHPKPRDIQSSDLSRYPWDMMRGLAQAIASRVWPLGQQEAPQHNANPARNTSDTGTAPAGRVPLAPDTAGTQLTSPPHTRPKRSRSRTPQSTRASKGLKALTLLSSGTLATGLPDKCTQQTCTTQALYSPYNRLTTADIMEITDCPLVDPMAKDLSLLDDAVMLQVAFKSRPLRDGGGKPSPGRVPPPRRLLLAWRTWGRRSWTWLSLSFPQHGGRHNVETSTILSQIPYSMSYVVLWEEVPLNLLHRDSHSIWI